MADTDYGFQSTSPRQGGREGGTSGVPMTKGQQQRQEQLASWWLSQLDRSLKRYMMRPVADRQEQLMHLMADYQRHVQDGAVRVPRFSLD